MTPTNSSICFFSLSLSLADFQLSQASSEFKPSGPARHCSIFDPVDDLIVESNETFEFQLQVQNELDSLADNISVFSLSIYDDDGKLLFVENLYEYNFIQLKFILGLMLATQSTTNIFEQSNMTRNLCLQSLEQRTLERVVVISLTPMLSGFATTSKFF